MGKNKVDSVNEKIKYEIAKELGLLDKVKQFGWKGLSAKETGKIGGMMTRRKKAALKEEQQSPMN